MCFEYAMPHDQIKAIEHTHLEIAAAEKEVHLVAHAPLRILDGCIDVIQLPVAAALNSNLRSRTGGRRRTSRAREST